ncbi:MAG TPA: archease [Vicinamibacteria bacterium]|nr:archease [Vicinamibacteria bacterium]
MRRASWEHFPHDADMGVRGLGSSLEEAFEGAALALCALTTELGEISGKESVEIRCEAPDREMLLVDWLNAIVFEMATRGMVFGAFRVTIDDGRLRGTAWGEKRDRERHDVGVEVKGATFTELRVAERGDGTWVAQCIVDV